MDTYLQVRHTDRQAYSLTGTQTDRHTDRQTGTQTDRQTYRQAYRQTGIQADRHTDRQAYRQTGIQADRRATYIQVDTYMQVRSAHWRQQNDTDTQVDTDMQVRHTDRQKCPLQTTERYRHTGRHGHAGQAYRHTGGRTDTSRSGIQTDRSVHCRQQNDTDRHTDRQKCPLHTTQRYRHTGGHGHAGQAYRQTDRSAHWRQQTDTDTQVNTDMQVRHTDRQKCPLQTTTRYRHTGGHRHAGQAYRQTDGSVHCRQQNDTDTQVDTDMQDRQTDRSVHCRQQND